MAQPKKQTEPLHLTPEQYDAFLQCRRPQRCDMILYLHYPAKACAIFKVAPENLPVNFGFSIDTRVAATLCWMAWSGARREGEFLSAFKQYEAEETMTNRIRSALSCSETGDQLASVLIDRLNLRAERVFLQEDRMWWQLNHPLVDVSNLKQPQAFDALIAAFAVLISTSSHIYTEITESA